MNILIGILFFAFVSLLIIFLVAYRIPRLLQVLLMRCMMNKVSERRYISKIRGIYELVKLRFKLRRGNSSDPSK